MSSARKGVRDVHVAQGDRAGVVPLLYGIHQAHLPADCGFVRRVGVDDGAPYGDCRVADHLLAGARKKSKGIRTYTADESK